jgi:hypothetical protein
MGFYFGNFSKTTKKAFLEIKMIALNKKIMCLLSDGTPFDSNCFKNHPK